MVDKRASPGKGTFTFANMLRPTYCYYSSRLFMGYLLLYHNISIVELSPLGFLALDCKLQNVIFGSISAYHLSCNELTKLLQCMSKSTVRNENKKTLVCAMGVWVMCELRVSELAVHCPPPLAQNCEQREPNI